MAEEKKIVDAPNCNVPTTSQNAMSTQKKKFEKKFFRITQFVWSSIRIALILPRIANSRGMWRHTHNNPLKTYFSLAPRFLILIYFTFYNNTYQCIREFATIIPRCVSSQ